MFHSLLVKTATEGYPNNYGFDLGKCTLRSEQSPSCPIVQVTTRTESPLRATHPHTGELINSLCSTLPQACTAAHRGVRARSHARRASFRAPPNLVSGLRYILSTDRILALSIFHNRMILYAEHTRSSSHACYDAPRVDQGRADQRL